MYVCDRLHIGRQTVRQVDLPVDQGHSAFAKPDTSFKNLPQVMRRLWHLCFVGRGNGFHAAGLQHTAALKHMELSAIGRGADAQSSIMKNKRNKQKPIHHSRAQAFDLGQPLTDVAFGPNRPEAETLSTRRCPFYFAGSHEFKRHRTHMHADKQTRSRKHMFVSVYLSMSIHPSSNIYVNIVCVCINIYIYAYVHSHTVASCSTATSHF